MTITTRKTFELKTPRFDPYKNVFIGKDCIMKVCTVCGPKPLSYENFGKDAQRAFGYNSQCRQCKNAYSRKYNADAYEEWKIRRAGGDITPWKIVSKRAV